ncbi:hypothetical protein D9M71_615490 [compost metagenome]
MLAGEHAAGQVDIDHPLPFAGRRGGDAALAGHAGGVHQYIEAAVARHHFGHHLFDIGFAAHVQGHELAGEIRRRVADIHPDHLRAFLGETPGACQADTRCRAGDDGDLALQSIHCTPLVLLFCGLTWRQSNQPPESGDRPMGLAMRQALVLLRPQQLVARGD